MITDCVNVWTLVKELEEAVERKLVERSNVSALVYAYPNYALFSGILGDEGAFSLGKACQRLPLCAMTEIAQ